MKNKPLSRYLRKKVVAAFANGLTASEAAKSLRINRNTINRYYRLLREGIAAYQENLNRTAALPETLRPDQPVAPTEATGAPVLALVETNGRVFARFVPSGLLETVQHPLRVGRMFLQYRLQHVDSFVLNGMELFLKRDTDAETPAEGGFETGSPSQLATLWAQARETLSRYYGVKAEYVHLYLREIEFRLNTRREDMERVLWHLLNGRTAHVA